MKAVEVLEGSRIRCGFYSKPRLPPHIRGREVWITPLPLRNAPFQIDDRGNGQDGPGSERHDRRRTRKGKSTWRWRTQETERSGIALLPFPLFPAEQLAAEDYGHKEGWTTGVGKRYSSSAPPRTQKEVLT